MARKGVAKPREKVRSMVLELGWTIISDSYEADFYERNGQVIGVDYINHLVMWLRESRMMQGFWMGRILGYDPILSGSEIFDMLMDGI